MVLVFPISVVVVVVVVGWVGIGLSGLSWILVGYVLVGPGVAGCLPCVAHWCGLVDGHKVAWALLHPPPCGWHW